MRNKALFVFADNQIGGAEKIMQIYAKMFLAQGFDIYFFYLVTGRLYEFDGQTENFSKKTWLRLGSYSLVFSSILMCNLYVQLASRLKILDAEKVIIRESTISRLRYKGSKAGLIKAAVRFTDSSKFYRIFQTQEMQEEFYDFFGLKQRLNHSVIPNPVEIQMMNDQNRDVVTFGADSEIAALQPYFLSVGRLIKEKGYFALIDAYSLQAYKSPRLVIIGEGPLKSEIQDYIRSKGLSDKVILLGQRDNVIPYMRNASLGIVSSYVEGFPNVLLEMLSCEIKVVTNEFIGLPLNGPYVVSDISNPLLFAKDLENAMSTAIDVSKTIEFLSVYRIDNVKSLLFKFLQI